MASAVATQNPGSGESLYRPFTCTIESITELTPLEKLFRLKRTDGKAFDHKPGQFMQVSIYGCGEAPISVASNVSRGDYLELGIRRAGSLTAAIHQMKVGDEVGLRGPFGTHFPTDEMKGKDVILVSGGCGLAPMRPLIQHCEDNRADFGKVTVLYGAKSPDDVMFKDDLTSWIQCEGIDCQQTVDNVTDETRGCWSDNVGLITTLIPPLEIDAAKTCAVIVGPPIMYKYVIQELEKKGVTADQIIVSLERHMKCGVGKCGHCTIDHIYCCQDGPVFKLSDVKDIKGAL